MSVCIASMAEKGNAFVVATDQKVSVGDSITIDEVMVKLDFLNHPATVAPFWAVLWAGRSITAVPPIIRRAQTELRKGNRPQPPLTSEQVAMTMATAYQHEVRLRIQADILSQYDLDLPTFMKDGVSMFREYFPLILEQIQNVRLNAEFLVCGFDEHSASMFTVGERGVVEHQDKMGFWIIGSGTELALSAFAHRQHNREKSLEETLCNVCEAKFCAELAPGVGKNTTVIVLDRHHYLRVVDRVTVDRMRAAWEAQGGLRPPVPEGARFAASEWVNGRGPRQAIRVTRQADPESTETKPDQPPSPESPEGSDES